MYEVVVFVVEELVFGDVYVVEVEFGGWIVFVFEFVFCVFDDEVVVNFGLDDE